MKKVEAKDLILDSDINVSSLKNRPNLIKYLDVLIAFIGVFSATYVFISSYDILHNDFLVVSSIIIFVLFFSFMFKKIKILKYTLLGSIGIYAVAFYMFYDYIRAGFMATWNIVAELISRNLMIDLFNYDISTKNKSFYISIFLIFIVYILSAIICYSIIYKPNFILLLIITLPILESGIYFNNMPSYSSFTLLVITWVSVFGMRTIKNKGKANKYKLEFKNKGKKHTYIVKGINRAITSRVGIILGLITAIIIGMTFTIYPPSTYEPTDNVQDLRAELDKIINNFTFEKFMDDLMDVGQGGVSGGQLGTIGKIKYKNETALEVTTPYFDKDIYLRGYIGCEYTGNSWEELSEELYYKNITDFEGIDGFNINGTMISGLNKIKDAQNLENYSADIAIANINANKKYLYVPYNSYTTNGYSSTTIQKQKESFQWVYDTNKYFFYYYPKLSDIDKAQEAAKYINDYNESSEGYDYTFELEKKYRDFAYEAYTILPEEGLEDIKNKYSGRYNETKDINRCITEATTAVNDGTTYDLAPGKLPKGKDFVEYFLNENKKGYCTHFASAATVILRAMGVPARYVEGYVIKENDADNARTKESGTVTEEVNRPVTKEDIDNGVTVSKMTGGDSSWCYVITFKNGSSVVTDSFNDGTVGINNSSSIISNGNDQSSGVINYTLDSNPNVITMDDGSGNVYTSSSNGNIFSSSTVIYGESDGKTVVTSKGDGKNSVNHFELNLEDNNSINIESNTTTINSVQDYSYNAENQLIDEKTGKVITITENQEVSCEIKTMDIKDTNAHAWVEVYIDNLGWIPIEVTPGYKEDSESVSAPIIEKKEDPTTNPTEVTSKPEENTTETIVKNETVIDNNATDEVNNSIGIKVLKLLISLIIIIFVIIIVIVLRHKIIIAKLTRSFTTKDNNKNVHNYYGYLMNIYKYVGIYNEDNLKVLEHTKTIEENYPFIEDGEFQEIINIVFKADFSQYKISIDELEKVTSFINKLNDKIYNSLSKTQKLNYTYLKNLR